MKKVTILLFALLSLSLQGQEKIMVIADPHVLAQSLIEEGTAFDEMMNEQRKMLHISQTAFTALIDTTLVYKPSLVLIPGDLTKDSELASHEVVVAQLKRLQQAGIPTLVIPGNHDIGGNAYAYKENQKVSTPNLTHNNWEKMYSFVYDKVTAKDPNSHSYIAEPLPHISILAIDGAHNNAGTGSLSDATLAWLLAQADSANQKGNTIIAMCHWQLLEHVDKSAMASSSTRLKNADAIRDSLMAHDVHVVLTGHMHINGMTTYRDTTGLTQDSIVEITTGAPITYPCPYRWLTISPDRATLQVETSEITTLPTIPDLNTYSREWMRQQAKLMLPELSLQLWSKTDQAFEMMANDPSLSGVLGAGVIAMIKQCLPQTDSAKIDLVERHLGSTVIELYLLHSEANEPERPQTDSIAQAMYKGMESMMREVTDPKFNNFLLRDIQDFIIAAAVVKAKEPIQSMVEDVTHWESVLYSDRTDDLSAIFIVNEPCVMTNIQNEHIRLQMMNNIYDILGRPVTSPQKGGIYIQKGKKVIVMQ